MHLEEISAGCPMPAKVQQICSTVLAVYGQQTVGRGTGGNSSQQNVAERTQAHAGEHDK